MQLKLRALLRGKTYQFRDLAEVMAKANEEKSGDRLAGLAAEDTLTRVAAKLVLSEIPLSAFLEYPAVPYAEDAVTRLILDNLSQPVWKTVKDWTVSQIFCGSVAACRRR
jgi:ethanolamine ammonia-lyase large subunit